MSVKLEAFVDFHLLILGSLTVLCPTYEPNAFSKTNKNFSSIDIIIR